MTCRLARVACLGAAILAAATLCVSCETAVEVEPPPHDPQLVPAGFFTRTGGAWVVRVSRSVPFTDAARPEYVSSATVEVWAEGERVARLPEVRPGAYATATGPDAEPGKQYTLRVDAEGVPPVEAQDAMPPAPPGVTFRDTLFEGGAEAPAHRRIEAELTIDDPPEESYYGLQIYQLRVLEDRQTGTFRILSPSLFPFESEDEAFGDELLPSVVDSDLKRYREAFFTDAPFAGERGTLEFQLEYEAPSPDADQRLRMAFVALLVSGSEDFYRYWTTASRQLATGENPFAEPLRVHSNVSGGGLGIFAGFHYRLIPLGGGVLEEETIAIDARRLCKAARRGTGNRLPIVCDALPSR